MAYQRKRKWRKNGVKENNGSEMAKQRRKRISWRKRLKSAMKAKWRNEIMWRK